MRPLLGRHVGAARQVRIDRAVIKAALERQARDQTIQGDLEPHDPTLEA